MAIKHYCDHCGKEIVDTINDMYDIGDEELLPWYWEYDDRRDFDGLELCKACYKERIAAHRKLDEEFFGKEKNDGVSV